MATLIESAREVLVESRLMHGFASTALVQASKHKPGSEEYHKWMGVHHKASAHGTKDDKQRDFHEKHAEHHMDHVSDEEYHNGDSHHWSGM